MRPETSAEMPAERGGSAVVARPGDAHVALVVVDVQNGFTTGGGLPVPHGEDVVPVINRIGRRFANVILTQDWHPPGHASFASSHPGRRAYEVIDLPYGPQMLWPDHCVQDTVDAALHPDLHLPQAQLVIRKGFRPQVDSYSAFQEADRTTPTGLDGYLKQRGITHLFVVGLATDFCVAWTALDARAAGYEVAVIEDATRPIDLDGSLDAAWREMASCGVHRIQASELQQD